MTKSSHVDRFFLLYWLVPCIVVHPSLFLPCSGFSAPSRSLSLPRHPFTSSKVVLFSDSRSSHVLCAKVAHEIDDGEIEGAPFKSDKSVDTAAGVGSQDIKQASSGFFANYKFGDFTKSVVKNVGRRVTGNENYEIGDITQNTIRDLSGNDDYEFGDLSKAALERAGEAVSDFTGRSNYEVGDISREIIRRVQSGEYKVDDIILLCKILLTLGASLSTVSSALPAKLILQMMEVSLANEVGERLVSALATALDERFKKALTGDKNYKMGDFTKKSILRFVGKDESESYEFGDLSRAVASQMSQNGPSATKKDMGATGNISLDHQIIEELDKLDRDIQLDKQQT